MTKKKVLFVMPHFHVGGAEKVVVNLANNMDKNIFDVTILAITPNGQLREEIYSNVNVYDLNLERTMFSFFKIYTFVLRFNPSIVFSTLSRVNFVICLVSMLSGSNTKFIIREANIPSVDVDKFKFSVIYNFFYKTLYRFSDKIVCQTDCMAKDLIGCFNVPKNKVVTINNPVFLDKVRSGFLLEENPYINQGNIVACGKLDYQKGFDILIMAFSIVHKTKPELTLTIVGEGEERTKLEALISDLELNDCVDLVGFKKNPHPYIGNADLFVLSSRWEGLPNVVLESFSLSVPVVSFRYEGVDEVIRDGVNGSLVNNMSSSDLANAINIFFEEKFSYEFSIVHDRFNEKKILSSYEKLFLDLLR